MKINDFKYYDAGHTKNFIETNEHLAIVEYITKDELVLLKTVA